jgi:hypothetical protein
MATRRKPTKTLHPKPREKKVRLQAHPQLTRSEIERLKARAAGDMRSIGGYVAFLLIQHLNGRGNGRKRQKPAASPGDKRMTYSIGIPLTPDQKAQVQARARG